MSPRGHAAKTRRPYISTAELMDLTGITRKTLRVYEEAGICVPAHVGGEYYKYWTLEQAADIRTAQMMSRDGAALKDIAACLQQGDFSLVARARELAVDASRRQRRELRALALRMNMIEDFSRIEDAEGLYVRSIPQRWFALIPLDERFYETNDGGSYVAAYRRLRAFCDIVGWASSESHGVIREYDAAGSLVARYLTLALASQPLPVPKGPNFLDCGCYRAFSDELALPRCDRSRCRCCALYGRDLDEAERVQTERDRRHASRAGVDWRAHVVRASDLAVPYLSGPWSAYTKRRLKVGGVSVEDSLAVRPRLMPQETCLPYAVTACVLPAGRYLCRQTSNHDADGVPDDFFENVSALDRSPFTEAEERAAAKRLPFPFGAEDAQPPFPADGVFPEPFSFSPFSKTGDCDGEYQRVASEDFSRLRLRTEAGLSEHGDFLVCEMRTPFGRERADIKKELEVLVGIS